MAEEIADTEPPAPLKPSVGRQSARRARATAGPHRAGRTAAPSKASQPTKSVPAAKGVPAAKASAAAKAARTRFQRVGPIRRRLPPFPARALVLLGWSRLRCY